MEMRGWCLGNESEAKKKQAAIELEGRLFW